MKKLKFLLFIFNIINQFHESIRDRPENYNEIHKVDEEVFKKSYIPRNLDEVIDIQRDVDMVESGKLNDVC